VNNWVLRISLMKQQFIVTHRHTMRQEKLGWSSIDQHLKHVTFLQKYEDNQYFCGHYILTEGTFVTKLSNNAATSIWRIVWVMTNCRFMGHIAFSVHLFSFALKQVHSKRRISAVIKLKLNFWHILLFLVVIILTSMICMLQKLIRRQQIFWN
jgi:hypothetical protein